MALSCQQERKANKAGEGENMAKCAAKLRADVSDKKNCLKIAETDGDMTMRSDNDVRLAKKAFGEKSKFDLTVAETVNSSGVKPHFGKMG